MSILKPYTMNVNEKREAVIEILREHFQKDSASEVYTVGIALLEVARQAQLQKYELAVIDPDGNVVKRVIAF